MMKRRIWILTLFPEYFLPLVNCGIAGQALRGERSEYIQFEVRTVNIRNWGLGNYQAVDDTPYGGGPGMVMRADVLENAMKAGVIEAGQYGENWKEKLTVIFTSPRGKLWDNKLARQFANETLAHKHKDVVFICGRYEGVDERFLTQYVDQYYSIGDYVLTGGELAVMIMLDSSIRFVAGILGNKLSSLEDSFEDGLLECPQYTKPRIFNEEDVPEVLANGHHAKIADWQLSEKKRLTQRLRPDLWQQYSRENKKT